MIDKTIVIDGLGAIRRFFEIGQPSQAITFDSYQNIIDGAIELIHDQQSQIAMLVAAQHTMAEIMGEKQNRINIEQTLDETYGVTGGICPTCGNWIKSAHSFCGFCGQPIGWKKRLLGVGIEKQGCATIKEPDCRICGQSHCKYYHETRKLTECKSYIRMEGQ